MLIIANRLHVPRFARRAAWVAAAGLAVALALVLGRSLPRSVPRPVPVAFVASIVPTWSTAERYADEFEELRGLRPNGFPSLAEIGAEPNVSAHEFSDRTSDVLGRQIAAGAAGEVDAPGGCFALSLACEGPCWPIVIGVAPDGRCTRMVPAPHLDDSLLPWGWNSPLMNWSRTWFPSLPFTLRGGARGEQASIAFDAGYAMLSEFRDYAFVIAASGTGLGIAHPSEIDTLLERARGVDRPATSARIAGALRESGFAVQELAVRVP